MTTVDLPGLSLLNEISYGIPWLTDLVGWTDSTDKNIPVELLPNGYGAFDDDEPSHGPRAFTVYGQLEEGDVWALHRQVMSLESLPPGFAVTVTTAEGASSSKVRVNGKIEFTVIDEEAGAAEFQIPLFAADSRKYGPTVTQSTGLPVAGGGVVSPVVSPFQEIGGGNPGRVSITNTGGAVSAPTVTVTGGFALGFEIVCVELGRRVRVDRTILTDSTVTIAMGTGEVWLDGQSPINGDVTVGQWITIPPGETRTFQLTALGATSGTPTMSVAFAPADW